VHLPGLDPLALLAAVPESRPSLLWRAPGEDGWVGVGRALARRPDGGSVAALAEAAAELARRVGGGAPSPRVFFSVAFDPAAGTDVAFGRGDDGERWHGFAPVEAVIPEILVRCGRHESEAFLVGTLERLEELRRELDDLVDEARSEAALRLAGDRSARPRDDVANLVIEWAQAEHRANVVAALDSLCRSAHSPAPGEDCLSKVVLAHAVEVQVDRAFDPPALLAELGRSHPGCFLFALRPAPGAPVFLGASPERLARVEESASGERRVVSGALAGSAPRGETEEEDDALGRRLLTSAKDLEEHAIVGDMIAGALAPLCRRVDRWIEPVLEKLATVQHLYTPISGCLEPGRGVLDAVAALHPTPAVGGMPREGALAAIRKLERVARGLYAGVIGWADRDGRGDSAVAIRSALVDGARARVYAGGGIVATSDPDVEVEEARLKMAAVLGAMERAAARELVPEASP
jgi:isochorismate synthase